LDRVRQDVARRLGLIREDRREFLWVTDFPLFERDQASGALAPVHHPFTSPHPDDLALLDTAPEKARALAYDVVLNGLELGGGSIRISDPTVQSRMFRLLGIDEATAQARFGFLLEGLRAGAPPHGGIAFGLDRIAMLLAGASSPRALFEGAPTLVPAEDLRDLKLRVEESPK
jgi:aspartyl-tRNA synthetase